ncbi:M3 family oligoendopeptidase [Sutcliffiella rhizosphaerae]|uniref:Peptidase M3A/M3B catalytic domain-containing protein n=1 Tax=Sutcliffiella rhizosphaerae TaxID=2880967 RepID=A0ABN8AH12_9BACI|nr:M3 family oligoendopeptidase [Sutcliffiella rhizosphaerae]CAG9623569.1 hypothetical protein BACCIP111883_04387 [Sutcliffiella rhizosphaerae]
MNQTTYSQVWNLETIFQSGLETKQPSEFIEAISEDLTILEKRLSNIGTCEKHDIERLLTLLANIKIRLSQATSYVTCLSAQGNRNPEALVHRGKTSELSARYESLLLQIKRKLEKVNAAELNTFPFIVSEWQNDLNSVTNSDEIMGMINALSVDGFHAWGQMYQSFIGKMKIHMDINGRIKEFSVRQIINFRSHSNEQVRKQAHDALEKQCEVHEDFFAQILNHITGFRITLYNETILYDSLKRNRLTKDSLDAMWQAVRTTEPISFVEYLNQKAILQGHEKMKAYNFWAPDTDKEQTYTFEEAAEFLIENARKFGPELEQFTRNAFENGWIEAENRLGKHPIEFCASFPYTKESRVFLTYDGSITNVLTLAHELGHAFHNHAMKGENGLNRQYPLCIAETSSTFYEMVILEAALEKAVSEKDKLFLLNEKLKRSVMNFMNIHSRYIFEERVYAERAKGMVSTERINEIMSESLNESYYGTLDNPSVRSWIWTPHFYLTKTPFYNYPYTFGYLLASSLHAKYKETGLLFEEKYIRLLRDSGKMSIEDLVRKHLGGDITKASFWEKGMEICTNEAKEYIRLSRKIKNSH